MAHHASSKKAHKQSQKRRLRNRHIKSTVATSVKKAFQAVGQKQVESCKVTVHNAVRQLARASSKGVLHKRTAARRVSRLMRKAYQITQSA